MELITKEQFQKIVQVLKKYNIRYEHENKQRYHTLTFRGSKRDGYNDSNPIFKVEIAKFSEDSPKILWWGDIDAINPPKLKGWSSIGEIQRLNIGSTKSVISFDKLLSELRAGLKEAYELKDNKKDWGLKLQNKLAKDAIDYDERQKKAEQDTLKEFAKFNNEKPVTTNLTDSQRKAILHELNWLNFSSKDNEDIESSYIYDLYQKFKSTKGNSIYLSSEDMKNIRITFREDYYFDIMEEAAMGGDLKKKDYDTVHHVQDFLKKLGLKAPKISRWA